MFTRVTIFLIIILIAAAPLLPAQDQSQIVFEREVIRVYLDTNKIKVEGTYIFKNKLPTEGRLNLFYPLPVDSLHPFPDSVFVRAEGDIVPFQPAGAGVTFPIVVYGSSRAMLTVIYEQQCLDNTGCYILTSTREWEDPLKEADFEVYVPGHIELTWMAYEAEDRREKNGITMYAFYREDFWPDKDLCLKWRPKNN